MQRPRLQQGAYFTTPRTDVQFIPTGCTMLDLALGGGWAEGRIANVVGDKATGKTLLWIEAAANFIHKYPKGTVRVRETEAAFDERYAEALGLPLARCDFGKKPLLTVEDLFEDLQRCVRLGGHQLYVVDSLDALSDRDELARDIDKGSYGAAKAKKLSEMFRRIVSLVEDANMTILIVSQIRDKIGVTFGVKYTRSGGRALDFYASQVLLLAETGKLKKTVNKVTRVTGVSVRAKVTKNKVGLPYREAEFNIIFGYGIDDAAACQDWLLSIGEDPKHTEMATDAQLREHCHLRWWEIEAKFVRKESKYNGARS